MCVAFSVVFFYLFLNQCVSQRRSIFLEKSVCGTCTLAFWGTTLLFSKGGAGLVQS